MNKVGHTYTIMVIPEQIGKGMFSIRLSRGGIVFAGICSAIIVVAVVFLMYKSVEVAKKVHYFYALRDDNQILLNENTKLRAVCQKINRMDSIAAYLERISVAPQQRKGPHEQTLGMLEEKARNNDTIAAIIDGKKESESGDDRSIVEKKPPIREVNDLYKESTPNIFPVEGWITQGFSSEKVQDEAKHIGIDIAAAEGMIIVAPAPGTIIEVREDKDFGKLIVIKHDYGFVTRYGHCAAVFVSKNEKVERGQTIALVGNTGHSTAPHLHYEVMKNGKNRNPLDFISTSK